MGHQRLGILPATRPWKDVIALITGGASAAAVAAQTATAAEDSLMAASESVSLRFAFWLMAKIVLAARSDDFGHELRKLGLQVTDAPNLLEIGIAMTAAIDRVGRKALVPDDLCEIASKTASESLLAVAGRSETSLPGIVHAVEEAQSNLRGLSTPTQFAVLARDFMIRLLRRILAYFLSRTLSEHVGTGKRFQTFKDHHAFTEAIDLHCRETSVIVEEFAAGWYSKNKFTSGITQETAGGFIHHALEKMQSELRQRRGVAYA